MSPRAAMLAALPPRAAAALALAQQFDPSCDAASACIAAHELPHASPTRLALSIRATTRREKRQGGAHGPARFDRLDGLAEVGQTAGGDDPAALLEACQGVAARPDLVDALAEREPASDTRLLAERDGCTRRRIQQCLADRRGLEGQGQGVLL